MGKVSAWEVLVFCIALYVVTKPIVRGYKEGRAGTDLAPDPNAHQTTPKGAGSAFHWPFRGEFDFEIVGESHHQAVLGRLAGAHGTESANAEHVALIVPENQNPHDTQAVAVLISDELVGHMSRQDARSFRRRLAQKNLSNRITSCDAIVVGGWAGPSGSKAQYGVRLDLKPFE
ncbi:HIRAN domain-containing protein [Aromatoleum evansii]|uniref:HIRAN domain-containing protein n=1 Tax=Aromatoleum evansii TaxID=59406 RepID=A0ABZ1AKG1_AROEV|nr:HIRAN domain-containing protein [Aromatoleum evansii]